MIKINTSAQILNLQDLPFMTRSGDKDVPVTVGDVLFTELSAQNDVPLRMSWKLLPQFAKEDTDIEISTDDANILIKMIEKAATRPVDQRLNLVIYGRVLEMLEDKDN
jgi:hypothetical protein